MTNMEKKKKIRIMNGSRGIQLDVGKYKISMGMSGFHHSSNHDWNASYADSVDAPECDTVEVYIFDAKDKAALPEQVAPYFKVKDLPKLIYALSVDDLPLVFLICDQKP